MKQTLSILCVLFTLSAYSQEAVKVKVTKPGTLSTLLTKAQQDTCQHLVVSGKLNSADIKVLRKMAGAEGYGKLHTLDLKDATIAKSNEPYLIILNAEERVVPKLSVEYVQRTISLAGAAAPVPLNGMEEASWYSADEGLPAAEYYGGNPSPELRHANFFLLGNINRKLSKKAISLNMAQWKKMKRQKTKAKGHTIERGEDGHYTYVAQTRKKLFCEDMFYNCPNLQLVTIPQDKNLYNRVAIIDDPIRYMAGTRLILKKDLNRSFRQKHSYPYEIYLF